MSLSVVSLFVAAFCMGALRGRSGWSGGRAGSQGAVPAPFARACDMWSSVCFGFDWRWWHWLFASDGRPFSACLHGRPAREEWLEWRQGWLLRSGACPLPGRTMCGL